MFQPLRKEVHIAVQAANKSGQYIKEIRLFIVVTMKGNGNGAVPVNQISTNKQILSHKNLKQQL